MPNHVASSTNNPEKLTAAEDFWDHKTTFMMKNTKNTTPGKINEVRIIVSLQFTDCTTTRKNDTDR